MFSSSSIGNPFSYNNETLFTDSSKIEENHNNNSSQEDRPPLPFHFPSPFLDTGDAPHLAHLLPQKDHYQTTIINPETTSTSNCRHPRKRNGSTGGATTNPHPHPHPNPNPRRRTGKKDRHSKICTAQGLRDRRMRLSVQIARKFFDLQDSLGFDKASKTIEWLFSKSKSAIKEVTRNLPRVKQSSSVSTKSSNMKGVMIQDQESVHKADKGKGVEVSVGVPIEEKNGKSWKNSSYDPHQAKESRDKARARARERTRDKVIIRGLEKPIGTYDHHANPNSLEHQFPSEGIIESFLGTASANSSTARSIFGFQNNPAVSDGEDSNNNFLGISENWEMENARINSDYGALTNMVPMTANLEEQNPNPIADSSVYFQSQLISGNQFYCRWQ